MAMVRSAGRVVAAGAALGITSYAAWVAATWLRYGRGALCDQDTDPLLDRFIPTYEVAERHRIRISAPPAIVFAAAAEVDLEKSAAIRGIFRAREWLLGSDVPERDLPRPLLARSKALGWGILAYLPDREVVVGAVTQPWEADVTFRALPPYEFGAFAEPGHVKIAWTLRVEPLGTGASMFRTETRAVATDPTARAAFRKYWAFVSPGVKLIRTMALGLVKSEAERRAREAVESPASACQPRVSEDAIAIPVASSTQRAAVRRHGLRGS
jgi:hypothetical protein